MFNSNLNRLSFFLLTILFIFLEAALIFGFIAITQDSIIAFLESKPGPGRETVALFVLIVTLVFAICRANIANRRNRDRGGSRRFIWGYVTLLVILSFAVSAEFLTRKFGADADGNLGASILAIVSFSMWLRLLFSGSASLDGVNAEIAALASKYGAPQSDEPGGIAPLRQAQNNPPGLSPTNGRATFGRKQ